MARLKTGGSMWFGGEMIWRKSESASSSRWMRQASSNQSEAELPALTTLAQAPRATQAKSSSRGTHPNLPPFLAGDFSMAIPGHPLPDELHEVVVNHQLERNRPQKQLSG